MESLKSMMLLRRHRALLKNTEIKLEEDECETDETSGRSSETHKIFVKRCGT